MKYQIRPAPVTSYCGVARQLVVRVSQRCGLRDGEFIPSAGGLAGYDDKFPFLPCHRASQPLAALGHFAS
ncbi:MAG: hypothetical protein ACYDGR_17200 [Candidatus Dormibacteria bacterium]